MTTTDREPFEVLAELAVDDRDAHVYEHGWQSWSPSRAYRLDEQPYRPPGDPALIAAFRPEAMAPAHLFQGEGLLAVEPGRGAPRHVFAVESAADFVPSIRAERVGERLVISAPGPVRHVVDDGPHGLDGALARWAEDFGRAAGVTEVRRAPTVWCTWYHYFTRVTEADVDENLDAMDALHLPIEVVQVDDGWQREVGDWLPPTRFPSVPALVDRIRARGRRAGLWVAPFIAGSRSDLVRDHPDWLVGDGAGAPATMGRNWDQDLHALDLTHPGAQAYLRDVFETLREWGVDYFKIDFVYGGALAGARHDDAVAPVAAYRSGLELIRSAIGDAYLLGCGAPLLPTVGLVDAMRISPDTAPHWEPVGGDLSEPGARSAVVTGVGRAWQQGRFWINDPDCLIVRPAVERREDWAAHVERYGGLRASSDRLADLDEWGLETTRRLLAVSPTEPFVPSR